ncbi:MAG: hypothetical protein Q8P01_02325 [bacterium]|nr:hypothetical protein [bacterium]
MKEKKFIIPLLLFLVLGLSVFGTQIVLAAVGDVSVQRAPNDNESASRIVIAGQEEVLAKFKFTARNEAMAVNKLQVLITDGKNGNSFTAGAVDEVPLIKLYDGATQIGNAAGYPVTSSGASAGVVFIDGLNLQIPMNAQKTLTVKGVVNRIADGADAGSLVYVTLLNRGFEALGSTAKDTTIQVTTGNAMAVYKAMPVISLPTQPGSKLGAGETQVLRFRITANSGDVSWKKIQFQVKMAGAVMSALNAAPGTTGNVRVIDLTTMIPLNIATAISNSSLQGAPSNNRPINSSGLGFVTLILNTPQEIRAGQYKDYELSLTFQNVSATVGGASVSIQPYSGQLSNSRRGDLGRSISTLEGRVDGMPSFIWSDNSVSSHSEGSLDWFEGTSFVTGFMPPFKTVTNAGGVVGPVPPETAPGGGGGNASASLDVQLSATPSSQTVVRGTQNVPFLGFALRALSGDVKVTSLKFNAMAVSGTLSSSEAQNLALYDGSTRVSSERPLSSDLSVVFSDLNLSIPSGQTKNLVLKGNISANAGGGGCVCFIS